MQNILWIGWLLTVVTFIVGTLVTRHYKKQDRIQKLIDDITKRIMQIEDNALEYFIKSSTSVHNYQLILDVTRLSSQCNKLSKISNVHHGYSKKFIAFKQAITLLPQDQQQQFEYNAEEMLNIICSARKLIDFYA